MTLYLTRDACPLGGEPVAWVFVWSARPSRYPLEAGACWRAHADDSFRDYVGALWLPQCSRRFGTYPDDDHQVIAVEVRSPDEADAVRAYLDSIPGAA